MYDGWDRDVSKSAHFSSIRLFGSSGYGTYGGQTDRGIELDWVGGPWARARGWRCVTCHRPKTEFCGYADSSHNTDSDSREAW